MGTREPLIAATAHESVADPESVDVSYLRIAARRGNWKYIHHDVGVDGPSSGVLYDLEGDPGETRDVTSERPATVDELESDVRSFQSELAFRGFTRAPDELRAQLRELGYLE